MRFMKNYGRVAHHAPAYAVNDEFSRVLHQQMEFFSSNPSANTLSRVRGEVGEASIFSSFANSPFLISFNFFTKYHGKQFILTKYCRKEYVILVIASKENTSSTTILQETGLNPEEEENTVVPCSFVEHYLF